MDQFFNHMNCIVPLSTKSEEAFRKILTKKTYPAKYKLCEIGKIPSKIGYLKLGIARAFMISPKGKEYNKSIFAKGEFLASYTSLIQNTPSKYTIECLTDCVVINCNYVEFMNLVVLYNDIGRLHRKNIERVYLYMHNRNLDFLTLDATQRYLNLCNRIPNIDSLITQKQIANHLAITPIQLSRIRKKLLYSNL